MPPWVKIKFNIGAQLIKIYSEDTWLFMDFRTRNLLKAIPSPATQKLISKKKKKKKTHNLILLEF